MSDKTFSLTKSEIKFRVNRLLNHQECVKALLHFITHCESSFEDEIESLNLNYDYPIISENVIPFSLGNYHKQFLSERMQSFLQYLSDHPDLANHFCDLLFMKYIPLTEGLVKSS